MFAKFKRFHLNLKILFLTYYFGSIFNNNEYREYLMETFNYVNLLEIYLRKV